MWRDYIGVSLCAAAIYISYALYGIAQEGIMATEYESSDGSPPERFRNTLFMLFVQSLFNSGLALALHVASRDAVPSGVPQFRYASVALTYIVAMFCSNSSLKYIDYPTQVLGKSCKPVAVLLIGLLLCRPQPAYKFVSVAVLTCGISLFMSQRVHGRVADSLDPSMLLTGRLLILGSLACDGFTGVFQDRLVHAYRPSNLLMMMYTNLWAGVYLAGALVVTGSAVDGVAFCQRHPEILAKLAAFSVCSAVGQVFIYYSVRHYGSLSCTIITTTRKFFTILLSVTLYGHTLSQTQWIAIAVVFGGLFMHVGFGYYFGSKKAKKVE